MEENQTSETEEFGSFADYVANRLTPLFKRAEIKEPSKGFMEGIVEMFTGRSEPNIWSEQNEALKETIDQLKQLNEKVASGYALDAEEKKTLNALQERLQLMKRAVELYDKQSGPLTDAELRKDLTKSIALIDDALAQVVTIQEVLRKQEEPAENTGQANANQSNTNQANADQGKGRELSAETSEEKKVEPDPLAKQKQELKRMFIESQIQQGIVDSQAEQNWQLVQDTLKNPLAIANATRAVISQMNMFTAQENSKMHAATVGVAAAGLGNFAPLLKIAITEAGKSLLGTTPVAGTERGEAVIQHVPNDLPSVAPNSGMGMGGKYKRDNGLLDAAPGGFDLPADALRPTNIPFPGNSPGGLNRR